MRWTFCTLRYKLLHLLKVDALLKVVLISLAVACSCSYSVSKADEPNEGQLRPAIVLPATVESVIDGDTVELELKIRVVVRLKECWADEVRTLDPEEKKRGIASKDNLQKYAEGQPATLYVPLDEGNGFADLFSFGRILGYVNVEGKDLSQYQVDSGHARSSKNGSN